MSVKPIGKRVLLKMLSSEEKTSGGIYIPAVAQEKTQEGVVVEIGNECDIDIKKGDCVVYDKYSGAQIKVQGEDLLLVKAEDILAVLNK